MRLLILGASGMLGHQLLSYFSHHAHGYKVVGTVRKTSSISHWVDRLDSKPKIIDSLSVENERSYRRVLTDVRPDTVINCIGLVKQLPAANDPLQSITVNALFPHQLAAWCAELGVRVVHISTDCVFDGLRGYYREDDLVTAQDMYGQTKALGELRNYKHCVTIRTSIIGHELGKPHGLIGWFLRQDGTVKGYCEANFSGLPTVELAEVLSKYVLKDLSIHGLYHVAASKISKYDLLNLVAEEYKKNITIQPDHLVKVDRTLLARRFEEITGYSPPSWPALVGKMHEDHKRWGG